MSVFYKWRFVSMEPAGDGFHEVLTYRGYPTWIGRLCGFKETIDRYWGNCTVWHRMPSFQRCGTFTESMLCDVWTRENYRRTADRIEELHVKTEPLP